MTAPFKPGDRVSWRGRLGTVTSDYWRHRDRFSVRFDGDDHDLDSAPKPSDLFVKRRTSE
jgi:hypothetical protein